MQVAELMTWVETAEHALAQVREALSVEDPQVLTESVPEPLTTAAVSLPDEKSEVDAILNAAAVPQVTPEQIAELLRVAQSLGMTPEEFTAKTREFFGVESLEELPATGPKSAEVLLASMQKRVSYGA
jgi:hypothetical protein